MRLFIFSLICFYNLSLFAQENTEMVTRNYQTAGGFYLLKNAHLDSGCFCSAHIEKVGINTQGELGDQMKHDIAVEMGVTFPEGSWINHEGAGNVSMHNTPQNHVQFKKALYSQGMLPKQVQLTFRILEFSNKDIEKLDRAHPTGIPDAAIISLWQNGKGETTFIQSFKTVHGVNAVIENVDEITYPTEITSANKMGHPPLYAGLETRSVGNILNITPTIDYNAETINLVLLPERADLVGHNPDATDNIVPITPTFRSFNLTTSMIIRNGSTLIAGYSSTIENKHQIYMVVSALLIDDQGNAINFSEN